MPAIATKSGAGSHANQDRATYFDHPTGVVIVVADGAGGSGGGEIAAELLTSCVQAALIQEPILAPNVCSAALAAADQTLGLDPRAGECTGVIVVITDRTMFGASVGDSAAWLIDNDTTHDLTAAQARKPLLGSRTAEPRHFEPVPFCGTLVVGTDGLFNYVNRNMVAECARLDDLHHVAEHLTELAQLPSGEFQDDTTIVVCRPDSQRQPTSPLALLLVENHAVFAETVVKQFLQEYDVTRAASVAEAKRQLDAYHFEFVLVDFDLDDGKGVDIVRSARRVSPRPVVIGISAHDAGNSRLVEAGADGICKKTGFHTIGAVLAAHTRPPSRNAGASGEIGRARDSSVDRMTGTLLGGFVGDALGRPFEGTPLGSLQRLRGQVLRRAWGDGSWGYTDDTEMAMGVAETLVASGRLDPEALVRNLARNCDVGRGYGMGTRRALEAATRGQDWQSVRYTSWPSGSKGNGGAVRVAPIACFYAGDPGALVDAADASAVVTHAHIEARTGARLFALATAHALRSPSPEGLGASELLASLRGHAARVPKYVRRLDDIKALLQQPSVSAEEAARTIGHRVLAVESVSLALYAFLRWHTSFEEAVINAIALGGDTDSIGAMTGSMAGALHGVRAIPARWLSCLENGPRGRDYAVLLAERLFDASTSHHKNG